MRSGDAYRAAWGYPLSRTVLCSDNHNSSDSYYLTTLPEVLTLHYPHCMRQVLTTIKQATETVEMTPDKVEQQARGRDKHRAFGWTMELTAAISLNGPFLRQACNRRHGTRISGNISGTTSAMFRLPPLQARRIAAAATSSPML